MKWLAEKSDDWLQQFYTLLSEEPTRRIKPLRIIRLGNGDFSIGEKCFFPTEEMKNDQKFLWVAKGVYSSGSNEEQKEKVRKFLEDLGVRELDIVEEVIEGILPKYKDGSVTVAPEQNTHDLKKIERAYETDSREKKRRLQIALRRTPFILAECPNEGGTVYQKPEQVFFGTKEIRTYFTGNDSFVCISPDHPHASLLRDLGISDSIRIACKSKPRSTAHVHLAPDWNHRRGLEGFDPDISVEGLECALTNPSIEKSEIIWNKIAVDYSHCIKGELLISSRQDFSPNASTYKREKVISEKFGRLLIENIWLPDSDGRLHKPSELTLDDLPKTFVHDEKLANQLGMKKNVVAKLADEFGVKQETIQLAKELEEHPDKLEEVRKFLTRKEENQKPAFPKSPASNLQRRREKLAEQHGSAPDKEYETRERSIRTTRGTIDSSAYTYLKHRYTNEDGQMICQVCKEEMPFKKRDGEHYFEKVEALSSDYFPKEHKAQFLALCPLCAAMYNEFVKLDKTALEELYHALKNSDELEVPLELGELQTSIRFVETHCSDIKTILRIPPHPSPLPPREREQETSNG